WNCRPSALTLGPQAALALSCAPARLIVLLRTANKPELQKMAHAQVELERRLNRLASPLYILGSFLFIVSAGDLLITMWTSHMSDPLYRYSAVSASTRGLVVPILGLTILQLTAALFGHRRVRAVLLVLSVFLLVGILFL